MKILNIEKITNRTTCTFIIVSILTMYNSSTTGHASEVTRIQIENPNYKLQKYEPKEGTYLGTYILQDKRVIGKGHPLAENKNNHINYINSFENNVANTNGMGQHASYFKYIGYKTGDLDKLYNWIEAVISSDAIPHIALEPNNTIINGKKVKGLDLIQKDSYLIDFAKKLGKYKSPIFLRYASEMNGTWTDYHGEPQKYKDKWKIVHDTMEQYAPNVIMTWVPNDEPAKLSDEYYPGDEYVDWVGVNTYHPMYSGNDKNKPAKDMVQTDKIDYFYNKYSHKKPLFIGEYGTAHHTTADNNADNTKHAIRNLKELYSSIETEYPRIKAIFYFNVNTQEDGSISDMARRARNYSITDGKYGLSFIDAYRNATKSHHFIKEVKQNSIDYRGLKDGELINLEHGLITLNDKQFIAIGDLAKSLGGSCNVKNNDIELNLLGKKEVIKIDNNNIKNVNGLNYISLELFCSKYSYKLDYNSITKTYTLDNLTNNYKDNKDERLVKTDTKIYETPGNKPIGFAYKSTILDLLSIEKNWVRIRTKEGQTGYINRAYVANLVTKEIGIRKIKTNTIVYSSMNQGSVLANTSAGDIVQLFKVDGNWAEIKTKSGSRGYVDRAKLATI